MSKVTRPLLPLLTLALPLALAGCPGDYSGGYDKVSFRERTPLAVAAAPDPPPVVAGIGGSSGSDAPQLPEGAAPSGVTQEMVVEGPQLYGTICTACHGPGGTGTAAGPSLTDQNWLHIGGGYDEIVGIIQTGVPSPVQYPAPMPPLGGGNFTPDQVRAIAAYIFALSQDGA